VWCCRRLYVTNEYLLRRPLGAVVVHAERERWADTVVHVFTFGEGDRDLIVPTALYDFGLLPCVGFYFAAEDFAAHGNQLRLHAATWGPSGSTRPRSTAISSTQDDRVQARFELKRSEDNLFFGIGPDVTDGGRSRYGLERVEGSLGYRRKLAATSRIDFETGVHRIGFVEGRVLRRPGARRADSRPAR